MIDSVRAVTELSEEDVESTPEVGSRLRLDYIDGIGKADEQFAILLNIERILQINELSDFN
jgi:purine-binding chemotaxis protein CheW